MGSTEKELERQITAGQNGFPVDFRRSARMPELGWALGYPFAILLMAGVCVSLYFIFKRRDWL